MKTTLLLGQAMPLANTEKRDPVEIVSLVLALIGFLLTGLADGTGHYASFSHTISFFFALGAAATGVCSLSTPPRFRIAPFIGLCIAAMLLIWLVPDLTTT